MSLTVKFTSLLCSNAYIVTYPIYDMKYDVSIGSKVLITQLNWEKSDLDCPDIKYKLIDKDTGGNLDSIFSFSSQNELSVQTSNSAKAKLYRLHVTALMGGF